MPAAGGSCLRKANPETMLPFQNLRQMSAYLLQQEGLYGWLLLLGLLVFSII